MALTVTRYVGSRTSAGNTAIYTCPSGKLAKVVLASGAHLGGDDDDDVPNRAWSAANNTWAYLKVGGAVAVSNRYDSQASSFYTHVRSAATLYCVAGQTISATTVGTSASVFWDFLIFEEDF